jgi:hypothetical protein
MHLSHPENAPVQAQTSEAKMVKKSEAKKQNRRISVGYGKV